ncbi:putative phage tail protein [Aeromonas hydrophila]|uniref:putative phage tail protein n=1 Tax=Aeromonas hydrophila TaxID=644 RepID=UPI00292A5973|nr:putative phage tail protein [Aeromonas hydrophila]
MAKFTMPLHFESRRNAVIEKYHRKGGLQTWQIEALALALGFTVEVREHFPHHVLRPVTYPIWPNRWRYTLEVVVFGLPDGRFRVTDNVMTPLKTQTALLLECTLSRYKLGGFTYEYVYEV